MPYRDPPDVDALILAIRDDRLDDIPRPEAGEPGRSRFVPDREPVLIRPAHLAGTVPRRLDEQRTDSIYVECFRCTRPDARRIQPMHFGQTASGPVELGPATAPAFDGESRCRQPP